MSAFSIILRILTIGACFAALYLWTDKQQVIAQKEAIIQEREYLVGYPKMERPKGDEVTMNNEIRGERFAVIQEDRPHDPSYTRLKQLREELVQIKQSDMDYGYGVKEIGGYDPNKSLTLRTHIEEQGRDIQHKKKQINGLNQEVEELEDELKEQKAFLGEEIQKVAELRKTILQRDAEISDLNFKFEQLKGEFDDALSRFQEQLEQQRKTLLAQVEAVRIQLRQSEAVVAQQKIEMAKLTQINSALRHQIKHLKSSSNTIPVDLDVKDENGDKIKPDRKQPRSLKLETRFYQFIKKPKHLILLAGSQSGIKKFEDKLVNIQIGNQQLKELQVVKVSDQYSILLLPRNASPDVIRRLQQVKSLTEVTLESSE